MAWPIARLVKQKTAVASMTNCLIALVDFIRINYVSWFGVILGLVKSEFVDAILDHEMV